MLLKFGDNQFNHLIDIVSIDAISSFDFKRMKEDNVTMFCTLTLKSGKEFSFYWVIKEPELIFNKIQLPDDNEFEEITDQLVCEIVLPKVEIKKILKKWTYQQIVDENSKEFQKAFMEYNDIICQYKKFHENV